jgi:transcriptional regulator with XRE-family HTH domain
MQQAGEGRNLFAEEFERVLVDTDTSVGRLARLSGIPRRTLENWLYGNTLHPRHVEPILQIARVLHLPENITDRLLLSAGHPSLSDLRQGEKTLPAEFLRNWQLTPQFSRDNIPAIATPLIGREKELDAISKMLDDPDIRLVTITGLGGIGKTRLAQEIARQ